MRNHRQSMMNDTRTDARGEQPCQQCDVMNRALDDFE